MLGDQPLGGGDEVIEHNLLMMAVRLAMPVLPVFTTTADVGYRKHATQLEPRNFCGAEVRKLGYAEAAVAIQQDRIVAVELEPLAVGQQHGNTRAVLAFVEHLLFLEIVRIEVRLGRTEHMTLTGLKVVAIHSRWRDEIVECIERRSILGSAEESFRGARPG